MIGRALGPTWSSLREGDVLVSHLKFKEWCVVIVLEDACLNEDVGTRALRIVDEITHPGPRIAGEARIRADRSEIDLDMWELIRSEK